MRQYVFIIVVTAASSFVLSWMVWRIAMRYKLHPPIRDRDLHTRPTPRLGGVAIFFAVLIAFAVSSANPYFERFWADPRTVWAILAATALIVAVGVIDDLIDLDWMIKAAVQIAAALIVAIGGGLQLYVLPIGEVTYFSPGWSIFLTVASLVLVMNAVNFIDGLDGLLTGVVLIAATLFFVYSYMIVRDTGPTSYFNLATFIAAVIIGACVGFLPHNWNPARMFIGDSGALMLGLLLGTSAIAITGQLPPAVLESPTFSSTQLLGVLIPFLIPVILMAIPLLDFAMAVVRRMSQGKSPMSPDRKHLHHRMLEIGHRPKQATLIFYAWSAMASMAVLLMYIGPLDGWPGGIWIGAVFGLVGIVLCVVLTVTPSRPQKRPRPVAVPRTVHPPSAPASISKAS